MQESVMNEKKFISKYLDLYKKNLFERDVSKEIIKLKKLLLKTKKSNNKIIIEGNGGSAAIASHFSVDLTKNAKIRCTNYNESNLITCFSNDFLTISLFILYTFWQNSSTICAKF